MAYPVFCDWIQGRCLYKLYRYIHYSICRQLEPISRILVKWEITWQNGQKQHHHTWGIRHLKVPLVTNHLGHGEIRRFGWFLVLFGSHLWFVNPKHHGNLNYSHRVYRGFSQGRNKGQGRWFMTPLHSRSLTTKAPEKWWLEDDHILLGFGNFSGANC